MSYERSEDHGLGARLRRSREAAELTQEELASKVGLTAKAISALKRGEWKRPHPYTVRSLPDALGLLDTERCAPRFTATFRGARAYFETGEDPLGTMGLAAALAHSWVTRG